MKLLIQSFFLLLLFLSTASVGEIYKCNIAGKLVYTDEKCDGEVIYVETKNTISPPKVDDYYNSATWYAGGNGYTQALELSEKHNALIFIYFHTDWCGYCRKLESELLNTSGARTVLSRVVKVKINPEDGAMERSLFKKFGGRGYPAVFFQDTYDSRPKKQLLMKRQSGKWKTMSVNDLSSLLSSRS